MSLFHKDPEPKKDPKETEDWEKNLAAAQARREQGLAPDLENAPPSVDQTAAENRVHGSAVLGQDRHPDDNGGVHDGVNVSPDPFQGQPVRGAQPRAPSSAPDSHDQEIAVTTGPDGEVVDVQEVDSGSQKRKGKR